MVICLCLQRLLAPLMTVYTSDSTRYYADDRVRFYDEEVLPVSMDMPLDFHYHFQNRDDVRWLKSLYDEAKQRAVLSEDRFSLFDNLSMELEQKRHEKLKQKLQTLKNIADDTYYYIRPVTDFVKYYMDLVAVNIKANLPTTVYNGRNYRLENGA